MTSACGLEDLNKMSEDAFFAVVNWTNSRIEETQTAISDASKATGKFIVDGCKKTVTVVSSNPGYSTVLRVFAFATQMFDMLFSQHISSAKFDSLVARFHLGQGALRIIPAINYVVSGEFFKDMSEGKFWEVAAGIGFIGGGVALASIFLQSSGIYPEVESLVGSLHVWGVPFIDVAFGVALAALLVPKIEAFMRGENLWANGVDIINLASEVALCALSAMFITNHALILSLSFVAVSTSVCSMYMNA